MNRSKPRAILPLLFLVSALITLVTPQLALADGGVWTWMGGSDTINQAGIYGTQGVPDPVNVPGARQGSISWIDNAGNLWLLGGHGRDSLGNAGHLSDLWRYDTTLGEWTWMKGADTVNERGDYGYLGLPHSRDKPGARYHSVSWIDRLGNVWLLGGYGFVAPPVPGANLLNDLWRYEAARWTWMSGANTQNQAGVYGIQGTPAPTNVPGARYDSISWTDNSGDF